MKVIWGRVVKQTGWRMGRLDVTKSEGMFLSEVQHDYLVEQFHDMGTFKNPLECPTVVLERVEDFHALKDKGGVLGKLNVRVYFMIDTKRKAIVVLSVYKKEDEGDLPKWLMKRLRNRLAQAKASLEKG